MSRLANRWEKGQDIMLDVKTDYRLSFSLMVDDESNSMKGWDVNGVFDNGFKDVVDKLSLLTSIELDSQVLYFSRLSTSHEKKEKITVKELEGFLGANDWNENSLAGVEREVPIQFMAYLPPTRGFSILDKSNKNTNSFLVPGWGSVYILDVAVSEDNWIPRSRLQDAFLTFRTHLAHFLSITETEDGAVLDKDAKRWFLGYVHQAAHTLNGLNELCERMPHMTVLQRVSAMVDASLDDFDEMERLECNKLTGGNRKTCLVLARRSLKSAEEAFFDPSLLPQLYFPPEHYFAVFMPFLIPAFLPVVTASKKAFSKMRSSRTKVQVQ
eukprot:CAMPEP_0203756546 /NCGR_PEP_ID=MMETSP0098-20131031/9817_1 /ASSEMBLY_ACC=CAM_ASM_000208 /TAXON_ID=96639 /ORGANISM=" , Strain NY0313808BC1" /LENGTH=325 /DNA_ID=CAMNT_0050648473 /DNA_START=401 /DNA_END=1375 /DNA_ORIENTATION=+